MDLWIWSGHIHEGRQRECGWCISILIVMIGKKICIYIEMHVKYTFFAGNKEICAFLLLLLIWRFHYALRMCSFLPSQIFIIGNFIHYWICHNLMTLLLIMSHSQTEIFTKSQAHHEHIFFMFCISLSYDLAYSTLLILLVIKTSELNLNYHIVKFLPTVLPIAVVAVNTMFAFMYDESWVLCGHRLSSECIKDGGFLFVSENY